MRDHAGSGAADHPMVGRIGSVRRVGERQQIEQGEAASGRASLTRWHSPHLVFTSVLCYAMAFLPKWPICGATYLSLSGLVALRNLPSIYRTVPALFLLAAINLVCLALFAKARRTWTGFLSALTGIVITLLCGIQAKSGWGFAVGIAVTAGESWIGTRAGLRKNRAAGQRVGPCRM